MRILLIKTSSLGDVIHALPALTDAAWFVPNLTCDWVLEEAFAEIPTWHPVINKVIPIALRRWRKNPLNALMNGEVSEFLHDLRAEKYDLIIDAQGLFFKSGLIALFAHGVSCGYDRESVRDKWAALCYKQKFHVSKNAHAITRIRDLFAQALHYSLPKNAPSFAINIGSIPSNDWNGPTLIFLHGTSRADKCWPEEYWIELANLATQSGFSVLIPWGNQEEKARAERISANCQNVEILPKLNLTQLAQIFLQAKAVITVDSGLGHLAAALEIPTISIYTNTDPKLIGTVGKHVIHLLTPTAEEVWGAMNKWS